MCLKKGIFALSSSLLPCPPSHLVAQDVDSLLQVVVFRVQQRRLLALEGAVGVVLAKVADHGELRRETFDTWD